jgi:hypothetical protein
MVTMASLWFLNAMRRSLRSLSSFPLFLDKSCVVCCNERSCSTQNSCSPPIDKVNPAHLLKVGKSIKPGPESVCEVGLRAFFGAVFDLTEALECWYKVYVKI